MRSLNNNIYNFALALGFSLIIAVLSNNVVYCAETISSLTCSTAPDSTIHNGTNKTTFRYNCSIVIDRSNRTGLIVGVYATSDTSSHISGNGTQSITITSPQSRFLADGPAQGPGVPVAITTNSTASTVTVVKDNINNDTDASFTFDLIFENFDADKAENTFQQHYRVGLYRGPSLKDEYPTSPSSNYVEYTVPDKVYLTTTNPPTCSIDTASEVYDPTHYEESNNDISIEIKANNTWLLEVKLDNLPTETPNNYTVPATQNYFECNSGTGYTCWSGADVKVQYPSAGTDASNYIEVAKDPDQTQGNYTTGSSDDINLDAVTLTFTEFLKNQTSAYQPGTYNGTMTFNITAPR